MIDIELGEELLRQTGSIIEPEGTESKSLKFDAKGTPHILYRDGDGKLLKDTPIKPNSVNEEKVNSTKEMYEEIGEMKEENLRLVHHNRITAGVIFLLFVLSVVTLAWLMTVR